MKGTPHDHRLLIGLTGMYCAGKNRVATLLEARGFPVLDVDTLGHQGIERAQEAILERFGTGILGKDGSIDRKLLGAQVFGSPEALAWLETIVHPAANRLTEEWIHRQGDRPCVINAALLHRSSVFHQLDGIILVKAPGLTRLLRARKRDKLPWGQLIQRFRCQREFMAKYLTEPADIYNISNRGYGRFGSSFFRGSLERQLEVALTQLGMVKDAYPVEERLNQKWRSPN
ncbi:MAG: dephospho-CoA kinase [Treponema sp.]|jgi:dephospho-CoA kinase|nr:dephospho-CoA kinase [Treponema sp.]